MAKPAVQETFPRDTFDLVGRPVYRIDLHNGVAVGLGNHAKIQKTLLSAEAPDDTFPKPSGWFSATSMRVVEMGIHVVFPKHEKLVPFSNVYAADLAPA